MAEATEENIAAAERSETERSEPGLTGMLLKDAAVVFAALSLWAAADTWYVTTGLWLAQVVAVGDAILVGLVLASLFHEWGHYTGTIVAGGKATRVQPPSLTFFRFRFDFENNDRRQFYWMTAGGHVLHWSILLILLIALPLDTLGRIALVSSVFGFVVFATFIEYNVIRDVLDGADPETRLKELTKTDFRNAGMAGAMGGLFAIALLS